MQKDVIPGEAINTEGGCISGHGTYQAGDRLVSSLLGSVCRINKLVTVAARKKLWYSPEVGDVVVARVVSIGNKRWNVDINTLQDASLLLTAINLPGNVQRRKMESDEMMMREYFAMGDVLAAEVQVVHQGGGCSIHTRNEKYRKIESALVQDFPPGFVRKGKSHFVDVEGARVILGMNGRIAICSAGPSPTPQTRARVLDIFGQIRERYCAGLHIDDESLAQLLAA